MDKKNLQLGGLIAAIVIALAVIVTLFVKNAGDGQGARSADQSEVLNAIDKVGGDPNKLDPAMKKRFDEMNANNPFSSVNHYSQKPGGSAPVATSTYPAPPGGSAPGGSAAGGSSPMPAGSGSGGYPAPPGGG